MSTEVAIETLFNADPEFGTLCDLLYGPDVTRQEIYEDVFGVSKAQNSSGHPLLRRIGLAATLVGAGLGVKEVGEGLAATDEAGKYSFPKVGPKVAGALKSAESTVTGNKAGNAVVSALKKPKVRVGLAGGMLAGDAAASHGLSQQENPQPVAKGISLKGVMSGAREIGAGVAHGYKPPVSHAPVLLGSPEALAARRKAVPTTIKQAQGVGAALRHPIAAAGRYPRTAIVGGVTAGAVGVHLANKNKNTAVDDPANYMPGGTYSKSFVAEGTFSKFDDDKRLAFGWASVVKKDGLPVVDRQGDYIDWQDLEDAAYRYVLNSRVGGDMHKRAGERPHHVSDLVESFVVTPEKIEKMGLPADTPVGWWVGFKVHDDDTWQEVKKGGRTGFSIHGKGKRVDTSMDELVG